MSKFSFDKIQNGGDRLAEVHIFRHNSVSVAGSSAHTQKECGKPNVSVKGLTHQKIQLGYYNIDMVPYNLPNKLH